MKTQSQILGLLVFACGWVGEAVHAQAPVDRSAQPASVRAAPTASAAGSHAAEGEQGVRAEAELWREDGGAGLTAPDVGELAVESAAIGRRSTLGPARPGTGATVLEAPRPVPAGDRKAGGLLGKLFRAKQPLQMFNPFAPAEYGDGTENLAIDPVTGRAEGVVLFSIRLPSFTRAKVEAKPSAPREAPSSPDRAP